MSARVLFPGYIPLPAVSRLLVIEKSLTMCSFLKSAFSRLYQIEKEMTQLYEKAAGGHTEYLDLAARYQKQKGTGLVPGL